MERVEKGRFLLGRTTAVSKGRTEDLKMEKERENEELEVKERLGIYVYLILLLCCCSIHYGYGWVREVGMKEGNGRRRF